MTTPFEALETTQKELTQTMENRTKTKDKRQKTRRVFRKGEEHDDAL